ncbi:MAG TPA: PQQ-dependent sugar dehydrogenase [Vicinamibacterales bacterium]|nr:PQQ-dependent sugar dehydrogenase [Vicinamibacterales bacterium]
MTNRSLLSLVVCACFLVGGAVRPASAQIVLDVQDYAAAPITGKFGANGNASALARLNFVRPEPGSSGRWFANDLNGPLYIIDPVTHAFATYLDFNGRNGASGVFKRFSYAIDLGNGFVTFQFDPDYVHSGKFYTMHIEEQDVAESPLPDGRRVPGLKLDGYTASDPIDVPGASEREVVLIEWTDTNIANTTFEGTAREVLRMRINTHLHPPTDMIFNPTAKPGDADWRVMYLGSGDGGAGEQTDARRNNPQRLDTLVGKILRIIPDPAEHAKTSRLSGNGRYRIPNDNPFVKIAGAKGEVWALGLRNPHRLVWEVDPKQPSKNRLLVLSVGLSGWESVYIVKKGANFGYSEREGTQRLLPTNKDDALPNPDRIALRVSDTVTRGTVTPTYPVVEYNHTKGNAIGNGFVYRGSRLPALQGKFVFCDLLTGRIWYASYDEMLAADDGRPETTAEMHEVSIRWKAPNDPAAAPQVSPTMRPVVAAGYEARRRAEPSAPAGRVPGRADIRLALDAQGELYVVSKTDGMIRAVVGAELVTPAP